VDIHTIKSILTNFESTIVHALGTIKSTLEKDSYVPMVKEALLPVLL